jgi:hypothetical protein
MSNQSEYDLPMIFAKLISRQYQKEKYREPQVLRIEVSPHVQKPRHFPNPQKKAKPKPQPSTTQILGQILHATQPTTTALIYRVPGESYPQMVSLSQPIPRMAGVPVIARQRRPQETTQKKKPVQITQKPPVTQPQKSFHFLDDF